MLFNSINFALFLPIVFVLYWLLQNKKLCIQNLLLLIASYFFYACWDYRFLFLLIFSTFLDYFTAIQISKSNNKSVVKFWFWLSISINLGLLGVFKYFNFFVDTFVKAISNFGFNPSLSIIKIILPVGISFYTFHGLSYVIDIYKKRIKVEKNFIDYALFVSFFPLLIAGPIERATHLLPQIKIKRTFDYAKAADGLRQILWGLFKKIVIADQCAVFVNSIFAENSNYGGSTHVVGAFLFAFQIYADFSGYSDIAIGTARLFGIDLLRNFAFPYFSRDIAEFWRRWHISLSSWFKDYLYIPLGGSKGSMLSKIRNTFIVFLVSGFWHGANWTFIIWGLLNVLYILPSIILKSNRNNLDIVAKGKMLPTLKEFASIIITFGLTVFAWIFFRANSIREASDFISIMFSKSLFSIPELKPLPLFIMINFFILIEWIGREQQFALAKIGLKWPLFFRWGFYILLLILSGYFLIFVNNQQFIYFQF